jgi:CDP-glucose 4,6-dehydratase
MEGLVMRPDPAFWRGKRVLLSGHTGFKGAWLAIWLHRLGARVVGVALPPATEPDLFEWADVASLLEHRQLDIRDAPALVQCVQEVRPDIVLHLAAQALVRVGYAQPLETFSTNVMGTANLLEALRGQDQVRVAVVVTTDKVYQNREWAYPYREDDALGGHDPYSASKAAAEMVVASYRASFLAASGVALASARAGNVIGGGDWAQDRLLPDAFRAWSAGRTLEVRRPAAIRPWQHVIEPLAAYLLLAEQLWQDPAKAGAYNFGPQTAEVTTAGEMVQMAQAAFGRGEYALAPLAQGPHEAASLALEVAKAREVLGVRPHWTVAQAVQRSMAWYRNFSEGAQARLLCLADIAAYEASA